MNLMYRLILARNLFLIGVIAFFSWTVLLATPARPGSYVLLPGSGTDSSTTSAGLATTSFRSAACMGPSALFADNVTATSVRLSWYSLTAASTELSYTPASQSATGPWTTVSSLTAQFAAYSYTPTNLMPNTAYAWRVREFCSATDSSAYVAGPGFLIECPMPTNLRTDVIGFSSAVVGWSGTPGQTYDVQWRPQGATTPFSSATTTATGYRLQNLLEGGYEWQVRTRCGAGGNSVFTALQRFTTTCSAPFTTTDDVSSYGAVLAWSSTDAATRYTVQYQPVSVTGGTWATLSDLSGEQYALPSLTNGTTYVWRIQSVCSVSVTSAYSNTIAFTTACRVPTVSVSSVDRTSAALYWNFDYGVNYVVQWRPKGSTTWAYTSPVLNDFEFSGYVYGEQFALSNLTPGTGYEYQLKAICADGISSVFSPVDSFTTTACTSTTPGPANSISAYNSVLLNWSSEADLHEVRWRPAGTTAWNLATDIAGNSLSVRGLTGNTGYEWQIRGFCAGQAGQFTSLQTFTTTCGLPGFLTTCQTNTASHLTWSGPLGAAFDLQWRPVGGTWTTVSSLTTTEYRLTGLSPATNYEWQVRAVCGPGQLSGFATSVRFQTSATCPIPANITAAAYTSSCGQAFLSWSGCSGSLVTFEVQHKPQSSATWSASASQLTTSTFLVVNQITEGAAYDFRVRAVCSPGDTSAFVTTSVTMPLCPCAAIAGIGHNRISSSTAFLQWDGSQTAIRYEVRWRVGKTTAWTSATTTSQFYQLTNLTTDTPYDWQVRPVCAGGTTADYSLIGFFRTVCNVPGGLRISNVTALSASLSWDFIPGVQYEVRYRTGAGAWTTVSSLTGSIYSLTGLTDKTVYEWQVKALCNGGSSSDYANALFFTTQCAPPTNKLADLISQTSARLSWSGPSAAGYELQYRPIGGSFSAVSLGRVASYSLVGLTAGTPYEWQIRTLCDAGSSTSGFSAQPLMFQTLAAVAGAREAADTRAESVGRESIVLSISPNPAETDVRVLVQLATPGPATVSVLNLQGRWLRGWVSGQDSATHEATFDVGGWPVGLYLIRAEANGRVEVQKLLKK